jgi:WD40 repeat protein
VGWGSILNRLPDGRLVSAYSLDGKWFEVSGPKTGQTKRMTIDYQSEGAYVRFVFSGPGGKVWGASGHPPWTFTFDPKSQRTKILGRARSWQAADALGDRIFSAEYSGGWLSVFDARRPWSGEGKAESDNPRILAEYQPDINQPYAALVYPDGLHVLMSGWPGYGYVGGGLAIYDLKTGQSKLIRHADLVPDQSTYQLAALPNGDIVAGTNISGGHGTKPVAKEGMLYILDWKTKSVSYRTIPVPGAEGVDGLVVARDGLVYAITTPPTLFVFDPRSREVVHKRDLAGHGTIAYNGLKPGPDGKLYAVMSKALLRITPGTYAVEKLAEPPQPVRAGTAVMDGRLYFVIDSHLWSFALN